MANLVRAPDATAWELRGCWATGRRVALTLDGLPSVAGMVRQVAASGAFVVIDDGDPAGPIHVPVERVLAVHRPHFHEPAHWRPRSSGDAPLQGVFAGQQGIVAPLPVSEAAAVAMARAASMMLTGDMLETLAAVDRVDAGAPRTGQVAGEVGRSRAWAATRLRRLETVGLVVRVRAPGERRWRIGA